MSPTAAVFSISTNPVTYGLLAGAAVLLRYIEQPITCSLPTHRQHTHIVNWLPFAQMIWFMQKGLNV